MDPLQLRHQVAVERRPLDPVQRAGERAADGRVLVVPEPVPEPVPGCKSSRPSVPAYQLAGNTSCDTNNAPAAVDDAAETRENKPVHVAVLANDSDPDGDPLSVVEITAPAHGRVLAARRSGTVSYKPDTGFTGSDSFTYTISDGADGRDTATVTVTVEPK